MKNYIGSLLAMAAMVGYTCASINCTQPLEILSHEKKVLVRKYQCNQEVRNEDLQKEPEIFYDGHLSHHNNYTLFLLENNNNIGSYKIHWIITDIIPVNKSLTANKRDVEGYKPPMNNVTTSYTVLLYRHPFSLHLKSPSLTEKDNFIPHSWAAPIHNISLENNATFHVTGMNMSHLHPSRPIHPHTPTQTHTPPAYPTYQTFPSTRTTVQTQYVTQTVTEKRPGYHFYNSTNNNSTGHNSNTHPHKNGVSNNVCSLTFIFIPLISIIMKLIF